MPFVPSAGLVLGRLGAESASGRTLPHPLHLSLTRLPMEQVKDMGLLNHFRI